MEKVKIATFLKERKIKYKPIDANSSGLNRIEKINFNGDIFLAPIQTNTDMILIKDGDLVISGINVEKGALAIYHGNKDVLASIHYSAYEFDDNRIDITYLKWFLKSKTFKTLLLEQTGGGIKKEIKAKHLLPIEIHLPNLDTQRKIVKKIQLVNSDIEALNNQISYDLDNVSNLRQSILQQAIEGKLVSQDSNDEPASVLLEKIKAEKEQLIKEKKIKKQKDLPPINDEEKPFELPQGWEWCRLGDIADITDGTHQTPRYTEAGRPFLSAQNVKPFKFLPQVFRTVSETDYQQYVKTTKPQRGDILMARVGAGIGEAAIIDTDMEFAIYVSLCLIKPFIRMDMNYILNLLNSAYGRELSKKNTLGKGASQGNLNLGLIRGFLMPLPPPAEQQRIVEKVDSLMALCDELEQEVKTAKKYASQLMEAVLQEAFTEPNDKSDGANVVEFAPCVKTVVDEEEILMAARGKIKEDTMNNLLSRAKELVDKGV